MPTAHPNLHSFSYFSFLEGQASPADLVAAAAAAGQSALALTDRHRLSGAIQFVEACRELGIKPILGLTLAAAPDPSSTPPVLRDLVLLAMNRQGWASLCALSSWIHDLADSASPPHVPLDVLAQHSEGILCLSGSYLSGEEHYAASELHPEAHARLEALRVIFSDRLYVQIDHILHDPRLMGSLWRLAQEARLPVAATSATYFLTEDDHELQATLSAIRLNMRKDHVQLETLPARRAFFHSSPQLAGRYRDFPDALETAAKIVARCELELPLDRVQFPVLELPEGESVDERLRRLAIEGAQMRYGEVTPEIQDRLEHELRSIADQGYAPLFLIMADILRYAREADVPSGSRGSASSSLVAHCLGITSPDPIRLDLYFERFLNPARRSPPDIDVDLSSSRREQVLEYVYDRYGHEHVAMVATTARFRKRSALPRGGQSSRAFKQADPPAGEGPPAALVGAGPGAAITVCGCLCRIAGSIPRIW